MCKDMLLFFVLCDGKLNIFAYFVQPTLQTLIWTHHPVLVMNFMTQNVRK